MALSFSDKNLLKAKLHTNLVVKIVIKYEREHIENNDGQNEMGKTRGQCEDDNIKRLPPKDKCLEALWL
jgi:hypothetical protein